MQIFSALMTLLTVLISLGSGIWTVATYGWRDRQAVRVERLLTHASVPGLRDEAKEALRDEACSTTLWLLAQRKYPQRSSVMPPLLALAFLAPACLAASFPIGMTGQRLFISSLLWIAYLGAGLWMLSRIARSDADIATWKLYQMTRGAEINRVLPPTFLGGLREFIPSARRGKAANSIRILGNAFELQYADDEQGPGAPEEGDIQSWGLLAREIEPCHINAVIKEENDKLPPRCRQLHDQVSG